MKSLTKQQIGLKPIPLKIKNLRGGGICCSSKTYRDHIAFQHFQISRAFSIGFEKHSSTIINKKPQIMTDEEVLISFQWFINNEKNFWIISNDRNQASSFLDVSVEKMEQFFQILPKYLKTSGLMFYQLLKICNNLLQIIVKQQSFKKKRFIEFKRQQQFKIYLGEIQTQIRIESNKIWVTGVEFEMQMIQTAVTHLRNNSTKEAEVFLSFIAGLATSLLTFKLSDDIILSSQENAKMIFTNIVEKQILNPIETFKIYQFFKELKWKILLSLGRNSSVFLLLGSLKQFYEIHIQKAKNWIIHYCWVEMISDLLVYEPTILKEQFLREEWNEMIVEKLIRPLNYDKNEAYPIVQIENSNNQLSKYLLKCNFDYSELLYFKQSLLDESVKEISNFQLWNSYLTFDFKNFNSNSKKSQNEILISLIKHDEQLIDKISIYCKQQLDEYRSQDNQIFKLINWYQKSDSQLQQKNILKDLNLIMKKLELQFFKILFVLNEFVHYFNFYIQKLKQFELILFSNDVNEKKETSKLIILIQNIQKQYDEFFKSAFPQIFDVSRNLSTTIVKTQVNLNIRKFDFSEKKKMEETWFKEIEKFQKFLQQLNLNLLQVQEEGLLVITKMTIQNQNLQFNSQKFLQALIKIQNVQFQQNFLDQVKSDIEEIRIQKDEIKNSQQLQIITLSICNLERMIFSLLTFLQIQNRKTKNLISYLENLDASSQCHKQSTLDEKQLNLFLFKSLLLEQMKEFQNFNENLCDFKESADQIISNLIEPKQQILASNLQTETKQLFQNKINELVDTIGLFILYPDQQIKHKTYVSLMYSQQIQLVDQTVQKQDLNVSDEQSQQKLLNLISLLRQNNLKENIKKFKSLQRDWMDLQKYLINQLLFCEEISNQQNLKINELVFSKFQSVIDTTKDLINQCSTNLGNSIDFDDGMIQNFSISTFNDFFQYQKQLNEQYNNNKSKENYYIQFQIEYDQISYGKEVQQLNQVSKLFQDKSYKVRESLLYNLIRMQVESQEPKLLVFIQQLIKQFWILERDQNVRMMLNNPEFIEMQKKLFNYDLKTFSEQLKSEIQSIMKEIEQLEQEIKIEGKSQQGQDLESKLNEKYTRLEETFENVEKMSDKIGLNFLFLKDMAKDIKVIKNKIDKLMNAVDLVADDIRKLRGKTFTELLQIRKQKILELKKYRDLDSVYVELKTKELDSDTGDIIKTDSGNQISCLFRNNYDDFEGEINEFLWSDKEKIKDVMLIKGQAGSGKSRAARMIEEFLWEQQENQNSDKIFWTPIFVSLPQLKDPKHNLFQEALQLESYQFDSVQIRELLEAIQKNQMRIVLILDSYDEMKTENIESNLYSTNKLKQDFQIDCPGFKLKIIITVRTEILKQSNYQILFYGNSLKELKEIELLSFTKEQGTEYLKQYCLLSAKRKVKSAYEFINQTRGIQFKIQDFSEIWKSIEVLMDKKQSQKKVMSEPVQEERREKQQVYDQDSQKETKNQTEYFSIADQLANLQPAYIVKYFDLGSIKKDTETDSLTNSQMLTEKQISLIIKTLKKHKDFLNVKEEHIIALKKDLSHLWSEKKFQQTIKNIQIDHLLQTPFMMEIVVQVLPHMVQQFTEFSTIKDQFGQNYIDFKNQEKISKLLIQAFKYNDTNSQNDTLFLKNQFNQTQKQLEMILDKLEDEKIFSNYTISDNLIKQPPFLILNNKKINFGEEVDNVIKSLTKRKITIYEFYESFAKFYSETQLLKWRDLGKVINSESLMIDFQEFQESLALDMTYRQLTQVTYQTKGRLNFKKAQFQSLKQESWEDQYFDNQGDENYNKILKSCILISANGNTYQFNHKSIQEYFVGKYILELIEKIQIAQNDSIIFYIKQNQNLIKDHLFNQNEFNISQSQFQGSLKLIKEKFEMRDDLQDKLINIVKLSQDKQFTRASSNCFYIS